MMIRVAKARFRLCYHCNFLLSPLPPSSLLSISILLLLLVLLCIIIKLSYTVKGRKLFTTTSTPTISATTTAPPEQIHRGQNEDICMMAADSTTSPLRFVSQVKRNLSLILASFHRTGRHMRNKMKGTKRCDLFKTCYP